MDHSRPLTLLFLLIPFLSLTAQERVVDLNQVHERASSVQSFDNGPVIKNAPECLEVYSEYASMESEEGHEWTVIHQNNSPTAWHYTYQQHLFGVEVLDGILKIHTDLNHQTYLITDYSLNWPVSAQDKNRLSQLSKEALRNLVWVPGQNGELILLTRIKANESQSFDEFFNEQEESQFRVDRDRQLHSGDSTVYVQVFYPDPITSARSQYGGLLRDFEDHSNRLLNDERYVKTLEASFDSGYFHLENEYVKLVDKLGPHYPTLRSTSDTLFFDRSNPFFEEVNVYYHITRYREHLDSLGYASLCHYAIHCDAHADILDNSFYSNRFNPPHLLFGDGGVDDAEDATTTIHEYGHALADCASPQSINGTTRQAIDEGIGDYLAASYKREINDYHWEKVFPWDGHNEFWGGRWSGNDMVYPESDVGTKHIRGQMVTGIFMNLWDDLGRNQTDKLMLEVMHDLFNGMSYPDFADRIVDAEKRLYQGKYETEVCIVLSKHGLRDGCFVSTEDHVKVEEPLRFLNSSGFAEGSSSLIIVAPSTGELEVAVYDLQGTQVFFDVQVDTSIELSPEDFPPGTYLIAVKHQEKTEHFKTVRFRR